MADLRSLAVSRGKGTLIFDPELIQEEEGANYRDMESPETQAHIRKMANAIIAGGNAAFPAITIYNKNGNIYVRAGWCRRRAHVLAKAEGAPLKGILALQSEMAEDEATLDVLNSNDNFPLTPLEQAKAIKRLISFQWTSAEIAKRRGVTVQAINNMLALLDAPAPVVQMVQNGEISATFAIETVRREGAIFGTEKLKDAVENAKEQGKDHATKKHLPKKKVVPQPEEQITAHISPNTGCNNCYLLEKALLKIINAKNSEDQQQQIMNARRLVKS